MRSFLPVTIQLTILALLLAPLPVPAKRNALGEQLLKEDIKGQDTRTVPIGDDAGKGRDFVCKDGVCLPADADGKT